jgi:hypothetical protein
MGTQSDYFRNNAYKPKYFLGDRVIGKWNKIPFVGTVGNDTVISLEEGARISVHVDLPIVFENAVKTVIMVKHKDIRRLPECKDELSDIKKPKRAGKKS